MFYKCTTTNVLETWLCLSAPTGTHVLHLRGGAWESYQNPGHENVTSSLNGYSENFVLSEDESKFSESAPFTTTPCPKQAGFGHQYLKTVLWLASWIKGQSLSREPKIFNIKDDAKTKGK